MQVNWSVSHSETGQLYPFLSAHTDYPIFYFPSQKKNRFAPGVFIVPDTFKFFLKRYPFSQVDFTLPGSSSTIATWSLFLINTLNTRDFPW